MAHYGARILRKLTFRRKNYIPLKIVAPKFKTTINWETCAKQTSSGLVVKNYKMSRLMLTLLLWQIDTSSDALGRLAGDSGRKCGSARRERARRVPKIQSNQRWKFFARRLFSKLSHAPKLICLFFFMIFFYLKKWTDHCVEWESWRLSAEREILSGKD